MPQLSAIILAGGEGTRMKSDKPKTLSQVLDKPMLQWVIDALRKGSIKDICVVKGYKKECIEDYIATLDYPIDTVYQSQRLGTGHAVMMAKDFLNSHKGDVVILNGDAPFMDTQTILGALQLHNDKNSSATVISANVDDPTGYGRIVRNANGDLSAITEHKDANESVLKIHEVNSGGYWFDSEDLLSVLNKITSNNKAGEYYLPDAIKLLIDEGKSTQAFMADSSDAVLGANDPAQLAELNDIAKAKYDKYPY